MKKKTQPKYDACIDFSISNKCNLSCEYCFSKIHIKKNQNNNKINISKLIKTLNNTDKILNIKFSGHGEPFLTDNIIEASKKITKKHFVSFVTNLTSDKIENFCKNIDPKKTVYFIASFQLEELIRLKMLNKYINNYLLLKKNNYYLHANIVAYPPLIDKYIHYKKYLLKHDILINSKPFFGIWKNKKYPESYTDEEIEFFDLKQELIKNDIFHQKGKFCNLGYNILYSNINGDFFDCSSSKNTKINIYYNINFQKHIIKCKSNSCFCPVNVYEKYLFKKAMTEQKLQYILNKIFKIKKNKKINYILITNNINHKTLNKIKKHTKSIMKNFLSYCTISHTRNFLFIEKKIDYDFYIILMSEFSKEIIQKIINNIQNKTSSKILFCLDGINLNSKTNKKKYQILNELSEEIDVFFTLKKENEEYYNKYLDFKINEI